MISIIPLTSTDASFKQTTALDGTNYVFVFRWNDRAQAWHFDLSTEDGTPIAMGIRVVVSWPLLRRCVSERRPPGELIAVDTTDQGDPLRSDLGTRVVLTYIDAESVAELRVGA